MDKMSLIKLWPTEPRTSSYRSNERPFPIECVFPSGRQLLSYILQCSGLGREDRVAFPEWSSHCVVSAIGRYATPIPFREVARYNIKVKAVLLYEQWGWPILKEAMRDLEACVGDSVIIFDMVDSAHFEAEEKSDFKGSKDFYRFTSLSKLLGLPGGGIGSRNGSCLRFSSEEESETLLPLLDSKEVIPTLSSGIISNFVKSDVVALPSRVVDWIENNDLGKAIDEECLARQNNLNVILNSFLSNSWPSWMRDAIRNGAGPGIAPLLWGAPEKTLEATKSLLLRSHHVETEIYHFNWSGNPLKPLYEKCLAFPVHGMVKNIENFLHDIEV